MPSSADRRPGGHRNGGIAAAPQRPPGEDPAEQDEHGQDGKCARPAQSTRAIGSRGGVLRRPTGCGRRLSVRCLSPCRARQAVADIGEPLPREARENGIDEYQLGAERLAGERVARLGSLRVAGTHGISAVVEALPPAGATDTPGCQR